jgi:hypothetical protein
VPRCHGEEVGRRLRGEGGRRRQVRGVGFGIGRCGLSMRADSMQGPRINQKYAARRAKDGTASSSAIRVMDQGSTVAGHKEQRGPAVMDAEKTQGKRGSNRRADFHSSRGTRGVAQGRGRVRGCKTTRTHGLLYLSSIRPSQQDSLIYT